MLAGATGTRVHPMKTVHAVQTGRSRRQRRRAGEASRPFDINRSGMVLGEGAGAIVLEELDTAQARGATIYGEVVGHGHQHVADRNCVAHRDAALANVMRAALRDAGMTPDDVGHIHAHGLSTRTCDVDEARAIREVFGDAARAGHGRQELFRQPGRGQRHVELIASVLAMQSGQLFPILNYETPDPECPIAAVTSLSSDRPARAS